MEERYKPKYGTLIADIYDAAERDLDEKETDEDADLLEEYPLHWLRTLWLMQETIFAQINAGRASIAHLKPESGERQGREWLQARAVIAKQERAFQERITKIKVRREEARAVLGTSSLNSVFSTGAMIDTLDGAIRSIEAGNTERGIGILREALNRIDRYEIDREGKDDDD